MRRIALILVMVLFSAVVRADVTIMLNVVSSTEVEIGYEAGDPVRAFALDVVVVGGVITDVTDFAIGEDNHGFGIFPANFSRFITVDPTTGDVDDWGIPGYTPVADAGDAGAYGGLDTNGVTLEMASMYDTNAPGLTGTLCTVAVSEGTTKLCVYGNTLRGNIVLEDGTELVPGQPALPICVNIDDDCFPSSYTTYAAWVAYGKPECWCGIYGDPPCPYQCDGDCDCDNSGMPFRYQIYTGDLNCILANWKKKMGDPTLNPCADIDHKDSGMPFRYRVYTGDLNPIIANWKKKPPNLPNQCPRPE